MNVNRSISYLCVRQRGHYLMVRAPTDKEHGQWKVALESQTADNSRATYVRPVLRSVPHATKVSVSSSSSSSTSAASASVSSYRLIGLVVKASALRAEDPGFEPRLRRDFFRVKSYQ